MTQLWHKNSDAAKRGGREEGDTEDHLRTSELISPLTVVCRHMHRLFKIQSQLKNGTMEDGHEVAPMRS